jgi:hypothetical protein
VRGIVIAIAAICALASPALADQPDGLVFSYNDDQSGGLLLGNPVPDGSWGAMTWQACPPDAPCYAVSPDSASDRILHVGGVPPGTVFHATAANGDQSVSATSDPYHGPLKLVRPPGLSGHLRVGGVVRARAGLWSGGWGGEQPFLQLQACRTMRSSTCQVIASTFWWERCGGVAARLTKRYEGWYLRVADDRAGRQVVFPNFAVRRPQNLSPLAQSSNTAVRMLGRIRGSGARAETC